MRINDFIAYFCKRNMKLRLLAVVLFVTLGELSAVAAANEEEEIQGDGMGGNHVSINRTNEVKLPTNATTKTTTEDLSVNTQTKVGNKPVLTDVLDSETTTDDAANTSSQVTSTTDEHEGATLVSTESAFTTLPPTMSSTETKVLSTTEDASSSSEISSIATRKTWTRETFPPQSSRPTPPTGIPGSPEPGNTQKPGPPTWALVLMTILISFSFIFTAFFLLRRYCLRKRKEERRYLLAARSQEGFFFGEQSGQFGETL